jgi:hypothetical protein
MKLKLFWFVAFASLVAAAGCSEGPIKTVPVYGTITFLDRQPPTTTEIVFQPIRVDGPLRPTISNVEADGKYRMKAYTKSKGLIPGTYHVLLTFHDPRPGGDLKQESGWKHLEYDAGEVEVPAVSSGIEHNIEVSVKNDKGKKS